MFDRLLDQCAEKFGKPPRNIGFWDRLTYWRIVRPEWIYQYPNDQLETTFLMLPQLRRSGIVVWGHLIQANSLLFSPGGGDCPGEVVYSLDPTHRIDTAELESIARELASLKHSKPADPESAWFADYLTNEWTRAHGKPVPKVMSTHREVRASTIYVVRKHLPAPARSLEQSLMPIVVLPRPPYTAIVLPSRYWPQELIDWWKGSA